MIGSMLYALINPDACFLPTVLPSKSTERKVQLRLSSSKDLSDSHLINYVCMSRILAENLTFNTSRPGEF